MDLRKRWIQHLKKATKNENVVCCPPIVMTNFVQISPESYKH